jgi:two-component system response regulator HydG
MDFPQMLNSSDRESSPREYEQIIGNSPELERVLEQVKHVAPTDSTVLIEGETGTGKDRARNSQRQLAAGASFREAQLRRHSLGSAGK